MFRCDSCHVVSLPKISPILITVEERPKEYKVVKRGEFYGDPDETYFTTGTEIVREAKLCPGCAGTEVKPEVPVDYSSYVSMGRGVCAHASGCKKILSECPVCQRTIKTFQSFSLPTLNKALSEPKASGFKFSMAAIVVEAMMTRSAHSSKRAKADFEASYPLLKAFEQRGGGL